MKWHQRRLEVLTKGWVDEHEHSSLCLLLRDQFSCAHQVRLDLVILPDVWYRFGIWGWWVIFGHLRPQGQRMGSFQIRQELLGMVNAVSSLHLNGGGRHP